MAESEKSVKANNGEETEDETLGKKEKQRKARLRRRGPYRKAHADW